MSGLQLDHFVNAVGHAAQIRGLSVQHDILVTMRACTVSAPGGRPSLTRSSTTGTAFTRTFTTPLTQTGAPGTDVRGPSSRISRTCDTGMANHSPASLKLRYFSLSMEVGTRSRRLHRGPRRQRRYPAPAQERKECSGAHARGQEAGRHSMPLRRSPVSLKRRFHQQPKSPCRVTRSAAHRATLWP